MARENEADRRPLAAPAGSTGTTAIVPSDTTVLSPICHKIFLPNATAADTVTLRLLDGSTPQFVLAAGSTIIDVQFDQVRASGTSLHNNPIGFFPLT
jgi:hypothetical protein